MKPQNEIDNSEENTIKEIMQITASNNQFLKTVTNEETTNNLKIGQKLII